MAKTHVGVLIDESWSMDSIRSETIMNLNEFLGTLRSSKSKKDRKSLVTMAAFSTEDQYSHKMRYRVMYRAQKAAEIDRVTPEDYNPWLSTPLYDAVLRMIADIEEIAEDEDKVLIAIMTDGLENASSTGLQTVRDKIRAKEDAGWTFLYLASGLKEVAQAVKMGVDAQNVAVYDGTSRSSRGAVMGQAAMTVNSTAGNRSQSFGYSGKTAEEIEESYKPPKS